AVARLRSDFLPIVDFIPTLAFVAILWYGGHLVLDHRLQVGDLVAYNLYIAMLIQPMRVVGQLVAQATRAIASAARIDETLQAEPQIFDPPHPEALPDGPGEVRFENVSFRYGDGPQILRDLDLFVRGGESVAIVGATGS